MPCASNREATLRPEVFGKPPVKIILKKYNAYTIHMYIMVVINGPPENKTCTCFLCQQTKSSNHLKYTCPMKSYNQ